MIVARNIRLLAQQIREYDGRQCKTDMANPGHATHCRLWTARQAIVGRMIEAQL